LEEKYVMIVLCIGQLVEKWLRMEIFFCLRETVMTVVDFCTRTLSCQLLWVNVLSKCSACRR